MVLARIWDKIERFYETTGHNNGSDILGLIHTMRKKGFDHLLRAGQSLYTFILSRSRRHGLREDQSCIRFTFARDTAAMKIASRDESFSFDSIGYNPTLDILLKRLAAEPID